VNVQPSVGAPAYLGFDRNEYPGDENLKLLRQTFSYAGFWLNHPPGEKSNSWASKRRALESVGFGFLVVFNGRLSRELKTVSNADSLGKADGRSDDRYNIVGSLFRAELAQLFDANGFPCRWSHYSWQVRRRRKGNDVGIR